MPRIKALSARNFRGIREATLELNGRSLVLLGENGSGKSSFVDALEYLYAGKVSHLEGTQGLSTTRHAPHIQKAQEPTLVQVEYQEPAGRASRALGGTVEGPANLRDHLAWGAKGAFILRRKNLLDFILAQPATRYEQLAAIIGVSDLGKTERALAQARDEVSAQVDALDRQAQAEKDKLRDLLEETPLNRRHLLEALNRKLLAYGEPPLAFLDEMESRRVAVVARSHSPLDAARALKVQNLLARIATLYGVPTFTEQYHDYCTYVQHLQRDATRIREALFREVLRWSRRLIADCQLGYCPVCRREIDRDSMLTSLEERVRQADEIADEVKAAQQSKAALLHRIREEIAQVDAFTAECSALALGTDPQPFAQYGAWLNEIVTMLTPEPLDVDLERLTEIVEAPHAAGFLASLEAPSAALQTENDRLQSADGDRQAIAIIDLLTRVAESYKTLALLGPALAAKRATCDELTAVFDCFVSTKKTQVQHIYDELEADIAHFFRGLHKDEGYGEVRLAVQEDRRASTEIKLDFHQRQHEDPRAFNSEGHLDSLGLCIFLAFVKRFNAGFPIIVLDDVVSSIDARHRRNICELLLSEFGNYQLFITTHDYVWFEELIAHQRACNKTNGFINLQIVDWTLAAGPRMTRHRPRWERTDEKLANGDKDGAAADARKALESILFDLACSTGTAIVLRSDGRYTVGDLLAPCIARIKRLVPAVYEANQTIFGALDRHLFMGNLLVHDNPQAANASISEVREFVDAVKAFEALFTCPHCGRRIAYYRDARVMKCHCGQVTWPAKD